MSKLKDNILREKAEHSAIAEKELELAEQDRFQFDPVEHVYKLDGARMHGVTSILRIIAKPALINWAANMAVDYAIANSVDKGVEGEGNDTEPYFIINASTLAEARVAHTKAKESAGERGHDVHAEIEEYVKLCILKNNGNAIDFGSNNTQVQKFIDWAVRCEVRFLESEKRVYSQESWYAGTLDLVLEMDGKKYIADVKTSSAIYPEFYLQMAAYQGALEEMGEHTDIAGAMVINLPKRGGFEIGYNYAYADNRMAFLAALILYKQLNSITDPKKKVRAKKLNK